LSGDSRRGRPPLPAPILGVPRPDFDGHGITNLMSSIGSVLGAPPSPYPPSPLLEPKPLAGCRRLVLMVIDGLGYAYLTTAGRRSRLHSHLKGRLTSVFPPTTAAAIPTFLTGYPPQQHGFTGWFTYFRELGTLLTTLPFRPRCSSASLSETGLNPLALSAAPPIFDRLQADSFVVSPAHIAHSDFNRAFSGRAEIRPFRTLEEFFASIRDALETTSPRCYVYAYWAELDRLAHEFGIDSRQVRAHFRELDRAFSRFVEQLEGSRTTLLLTADHGFVDTAPRLAIQLADHPSLAEMLALPLCGESRTVFCYLRPGRERRFEDYVTSHLGHACHLLRSERLLAAGFFGRGKAHPRLNERIGDYTLLMKGRHILKDWILGEKAYQQVGVHGGITRDELYVPLVRVDC